MEEAGKAAGASSLAHHLQPEPEAKRANRNQGRHSDRQAQFQWRTSYNKVTFPRPPQTVPQQGTKRVQISEHIGDVLIQIVMLYFQNCEVGRTVIMFTL